MPTNKSLPYMFFICSYRSMSREMSDPPARRTRHDGWSAERRARFCAVLATTGNVRSAAHATGMSRQTAYRLRRRSSDFARAWAAAMAFHPAPPPRSADPASLWQRAMTGKQREIVYHGKRIALADRPDDKALIALLGQFDRHCRKGHTIL